MAGRRAPLVGGLINVVLLTIFVFVARVVALAWSTSVSEKPEAASIVVGWVLLTAVLLGGIGVVAAIPVHIVHVRRANGSLFGEEAIRAERAAAYGWGPLAGTTVIAFLFVVHCLVDAYQEHVRFRSYSP